MSFGMKRGFLKQTGQVPRSKNKNSAIQDPPSNAVVSAQRGMQFQFTDTCQLYSENPYIVVADHRAPTPSCFLFLPSKSDARMVIIDTLEDVQAISKLQVWDDLCPSPPKDPAFEIKQCGLDKGQGMFARRPLGLGELIMLERPVYVAPRKLEIHPDQKKSFDNASLAGLSLTAQASIASLRNSVPETDDIGFLRGIIITNAFPAKLPHTTEPRIALFANLCRANHDCRPNAHFFFSKETFTGRLTALRPIAAGEEITIGYIEIVAPRAKRQEDLKRYRFTCACQTCSLPPALAAASDARREVISAYFASTEDSGTPTNASLAHVQKLFRWAEEEGLVEAALSLSNSVLRIAQRDGNTAETLRSTMIAMKYIRVLQGIV